MAETHQSRLEHNLNNLSKMMNKLKVIRDKMVNSGEQHMSKWVEDVKRKEEELDEIRKALDDVDKHSYYTRIEKRNSLNAKVLESIRYVKHLNETSNRNADDMEIFISAILNDIPQHFSLEQLKKITSHDQIGCGEYGTVYKGRIGNRDVAVKKLKSNLNSTIKKKHFMAEVGTMMEVSHRNIVKLYGFCGEPAVKAFVYEFVENGSLDNFLHKNHSTVAWEKLYGIMVETAMGISYLHQYCNKGIIHRDINSSNVLLDKTDSPKIADFGLAKFYNRETGQTKLTTGFMGTKGFEAPEVLLGHSNVTNKCDVFSFGVMLFEMLNMRKLKNQETFQKEVWEKFEKEELDELLTECGIAGDDVASAKTLAVVAISCTQFKAEQRPSMSDVVKILEGEKELPSPGKPYSSDDLFSSTGSNSTGGPTRAQPVYRHRWKASENLSRK